MSWTLLVLLPLSPFLLLVLVYGTVTVVALVLARPKDRPDVLRHCTSVFGELIRKLPAVTPGRAALPAGDIQDNGDEAATEEGAP